PFDFGRTETAWISAQVTDGLGHGDAIGVLEFEVLLVEPPRHGATAQIRALVTHTFLIRKPNYLDAKWQIRLGCFEPLDASNPNEHSQRTIKFSRIHHSVQMRAHDKNLVFS